MTVYTIASDTYWTTGTSKGDESGDSFANRKQIPNDITGFSVTSGDIYFRIVREEGDRDFAVTGGPILSVNNTLTVTDASDNDDQTITHKVYIGGVNGDRVANLYFKFSSLSYCTMGRDSGGNDTVNFMSHQPMCIFRNCVFDANNFLFYYHIGTGLSLFISCEFKQSGSYGFYRSLNGCYFIDCTVDNSTLFQFTGTAEFYSLNFNPWGTMRKPLYAKENILRKSYFHIKDGDSNDLENILCFVKDANNKCAEIRGNSGKSDADGNIQSFLLSTHDSIHDVAELSKVDFVIAHEKTDIWRLGALVNATQGNKTETITLSDADNKTQFIFVDPTGAYETQVIERAMASDYGSSGTPTEITMVAAAVPTVDTIGTTDAAITTAEETIIHVTFTGTTPNEVACIINNDNIIHRMTWDAGDSRWETELIKGSEHGTGNWDIEIVADKAVIGTSAALVVVSAVTGRSQFDLLRTEIKDMFVNGMDSDGGETSPSGTPAYGGTSTGEDFDSLNVYDMQDIANAQNVYTVPCLKIYSEKTLVEQMLDGNMYATTFTIDSIATEHTTESVTGNSLTKTEYMEWLQERIEYILQHMVLTSVMDGARDNPQSIGPIGETENNEFVYKGQTACTFEYKAEIT